MVGCVAITDESPPTIRRIATLTTAVLLLLTVVPAVSLAPDASDLPGVAPSARARNVSDATTPVTENLTTTTSHCNGYIVIEDPINDALALAECLVNDVLGLVPPVPCVDESCPDPCNSVNCPEIYCVDKACPDPCNSVPCGPPPVPDYCNYIDCRIIDGFLYGGGTGDFEANENKVCDAGDPLWFSDQDGDGEFDCFDNDNDGDLLTDELEYKTKPYNMNNPTTDGFIRDDWDIAPGTTDYELAGVDMPKIDLADSGCDGVGSEPADPYIRHINHGTDNEETTLKVFHGANYSGGFDMASDTLLEDPEGWSKDNHIHSHDTEPFDPSWTLDGLNDVAVGPGAFDNHRYSLPHNVSLYNVDAAGEEPAIGLTFGLNDHDGHEGGGEEEIDLADGAALNAEFTYELRTESEELKPWTNPDATCFAKVRAVFDDIVPRTTNDIAVHRAANPHQMIYTDTV